MRAIYENIMDIKNVPQGWTLAAAFSTDMHCIGLPGYIDEMFDISNREISKQHKIGSVSRIDNLYMLFVKESSYDAPSWDALEKSMYKLAHKVDVKHIHKLAMPKICTGKYGFNWEQEVLPLIEEAFAYTDVEIMICCK